MHSKKAQIALFLIIGIIIAIMIMILLFLRSAEQKMSPSPEITETAAVQQFVQECIDKSAKESVLFISYQGGYYFNESLLFYEQVREDSPTIYSFLINSSSHVPTIDLAEANIAYRFNDLLVLCTNNFSDFKAVTVTAEDPSTKVEISGNVISFSIKYPLKIEKGTASVNLDNFNANVNAEFSMMLDAAKGFVEKQAEFPDSFLVSHLGVVALENGLDYRTSTSEKGDIIIFTKNESVIGQPYEFWFGLRYE